MHTTSPTLDVVRPERAGSVPPVAPAPAPGLSAGALYRLWRDRGAAPTGTRLALARARRLGRSGPGVWLWILAWYVAAQASLFVVMNRWRPTLQETAYREKVGQLRQLAAQANGRPLLVMLGSSRTEHAFQAGLLDGLPTPEGQSLLAYNFGVPRAGPMHEWLYLQEMLEAGIRPRLLLVEFLPPLLTVPGRGITSEESWTSASWMSLSQFLRLRPYITRCRRLTYRWIESRVAPCYAYRMELQTQWHERMFPGTTQRMDCPHDDRGWSLPMAFTNEARALYLDGARTMYVPSLRDLRLGEGQVRALRDLLSCCRREGIPVALVLMPESTAFHSWYSPRSLAAAHRVVAELRDTYGVAVIDAQNWLPDWDFIDGHHVLGGGAGRFTMLLRREVERLLARTAAPRNGHGPAQ